MWARVARRGALLAIHETENLQSSDKYISRYYELVADMQAYHGQKLNVGALLTDIFADCEWKVVSNRAIALTKSARDMAELHLANLNTWSRNEFSVRAFDRAEIEELVGHLGAIAIGNIDAGTVLNTARQIIAVRL
jgi:hypothetical protein